MAGLGGPDSAKAVPIPVDDAFALVPVRKVKLYQVALRSASQRTGNPHMTVKIIGADELRAKVRFEDLIAPMEEAFALASRGDAASDSIVIYPQKDRESCDVVVKTGTVAGQSTYIVKVAPWFPVHAANGKPQGGFIAVFDSATGRNLALLDEQHYLTDIRTCAAGAVAARHLAPEAVHTATVIGTGVQAYWQALALHHERRFARMVILGRSEAKATALGDRLKDRLPDVLIEIGTSTETAVRKADVIITATASRKPFIRADWLRPGQHITAVGSDDPTKCELHAGVLNAARVFVDQRDTNLRNGDIHRAIMSGDYEGDLLAGEIGDIILGRVDGRIDKGDITVAKLVGLGAQDLFAAEVALMHASNDAPLLSPKKPSDVEEMGSERVVESGLKRDASWCRCRRRISWEKIQTSPPAEDDHTDDRGSDDGENPSAAGSSENGAQSTRRGGWEGAHHSRSRTDE